MRFSKIVFDPFRTSLGAPKVAPNIFQQLHFVPGAFSAHRIGLHILIEQFIRVQLGAITGQEKKTHPQSMLFHPSLRRGGQMNRMPIHNQKNFSFGMANQSAEKSCKNGGGEPLFKDHERQLTPIRDCRNHITPKSLPCPQNDWGLPASSPRSSCLMIRPHPHFVAPKDRRSFLFGTNTNGWIFLFQPLAHFCWVLLVSSAKRFLRRKTPLLKITPHRPNRQRYSKFSNDQLLHRFPSPQNKRHLELIGTSIRD